MHGEKQLRLDEARYGDCPYHPDLYGILLPGKRGRLLSVLYTTAEEKAAVRLAKRPENKGKTLVALLPDTGDRDLSAPLFAD